MPARVLPTPFCFACLLLLVSAGCGGGGEETRTVPAGTRPSQPSGQGACRLLTQAEVDALFGSPAGTGVAESLGDGTELCSWPAGPEPRLLLQVGPKPANIRDAVDLGDGYRISDVTGMSGSAAVAIQELDSRAVVTLLAMQAAEKAVTISPVGILIQEDSPEFERLKTLVNAVATRF